MYLMQDHDCPKFAPGVRLHWNQVRQQFLLLFPEGALALNPTAAAVLELCDGQRSMAAIVHELTARYHGETVREDVHQLITRIVARGLLIMMSPIN